MEPTPQDTVPKTDFDRLQSEATEARQGMKALQTQLLSPDYLDYLESRKAPKAPPAGQADPNAAPIAAMTLAQLTAHIDQRTQQTFNGTNQRLSNVEARLELEFVRETYKDFDQVRDKVAELLQQPGNDLSIEQAYLIVKAKNPTAAPAPSDKTPAPAAPKGGEKPGTILPVDGDSAKTFKNAKEAGNAAWSEVATKWGISGDRL